MVEQRTQGVLTVPVPPRSWRSPTFCLCSRGWVKAVLTEALDEQVDVELVQAIGRGDEVCEFLVVPKRDQ